MNKEIPKAYDSKEVEDGIYKRWEQSGYFNPDNLDLSEKAKKFVISMPPPNVTGILHLGHALENTLMDTMIRYQRMRGKRTLLVPGTDHAAVATQAKVEKDLVKSGKYKNPREELGREKLLEIIRDYSEGSKATILSQIRKMGTSCDWDRLAYTFDEQRSKAVNEIFKRMYKDGLIYRGYRVVNWSVRGQSTCSDDELVYVERPAKLYTFKYSKDFPIPIATTRPETKLGDTAVAVHPEGKWKEFIGKTYEVKNFAGSVDLKIKIISDKNVDQKFGTGALGVTPAHSMIDFEMAEKNELPVIKIIGENGKMTGQAGKEYEGLTVVEAKEKVVEWLRKEGLLKKEEEIAQNVGTSDRFGDVVEVLPMTQWFIDVNKKIPGKKKCLKDLMREAVMIGHNGKAKQKIKITPDRFEKIYLHWIDNLRDWCISRQIYWGHRIPVWFKVNSDTAESFNLGRNASASSYVNDVTHYEFSVDNPGKKDNTEDRWIPETDTLDTWFSSGTWTFSTLGWPDKTKDLELFHPTSWMQMGSEILFFWMARMILMSTYAINQIPFENVYIHGILRDKDGRKFSKSLGNGIDPVEMIEKYGTDALRLSLIIGTTPGNDARFYEEKVENYRNLVNKLWNISRYVLMSVTEVKRIKKAPKAKTLADRWILAKLDDLVGFSTDNLEKYNFSAVGERLYEFTWNDFADWYIEISKVEKNKDEILLYVLERLLIMWHPFMPFATEEIWKNFASDRMLMVEKWPAKSLKKASSAKDLQEFGNIKEIVTAIRNLRSENKIEPKKKIKAVISAKKRESLLKDQIDVIRFLAGLSELETVQKMEKMKNAVSAVVSDCDIYIPMEGLVDFEKETENIKKEIENINAYLQLLGKKLNNARFVSNAPKEVVEKERLKYASAEEKLKKLIEKRDSLL